MSRKSIEQRFKVDSSALDDFDFRYFYSAFSNPLLPVVTQENAGSVELMRWGWIPFWVRSTDQAEQVRKATYNARSETLHEKASFKTPIKSQRCWVLAHGFFEWQHVGKTKIPWYIKLQNDHPFAFAGLYDRWTDPETGEIFHTCSIITTRANPLMEQIHNTKKRMPVLLGKDTEDHWIRPDLEPDKARQIMDPYPEQELQAYPVSDRLNKRQTDPNDATVIQALEHPSSPGLLF